MGSPYAPRPSRGPCASVEPPWINTTQSLGVSWPDAPGISTIVVTTGLPTPLATATSDQISVKRGLSYNDPTLTAAFQGAMVTWGYDWTSQAGELPLEIEYVPMLWGLGGTSTWMSDATAAIEAGSRHLLSFNEPDIPTQANLSPEVAAANHILYMNPLSDRAWIGSPAISNGVSDSQTMGIAWLEQFFKACDSFCVVDFVTFHWYSDASQPSDLQSHVENVASIASHNGIDTIWLTEFGVTGIEVDQELFLTSALAWLDGYDQVERYSYFMCGNGTLLDGSSLSGLGRIYSDG
ncbi:hypothetical protein LTR55_012096 [Exophiala xenobiotica]|nr:hypothetical protein LTR55_012096 [Exophiala xenobiotica]